MPFLNPDEVLMHVPNLVLVKKDEPPETMDEVLQGIRNLWERIVEDLRNDPETLKDFENDINSSLEEAGAWERVSLKDDSYLQLLNPEIVSGDGWGLGPKLFMMKLMEENFQPEVWLTPDDPQAQDPDLPTYLADNLFDPLYLPREYR